MSDNSGGLEPPARNSDNMDTQVSAKTSQDKIYDLENKYKPADRGPYFVYVEHLNKNIGRLFPVRVGHYLFNNEQFKSNIIDIKSVGLNRVKVIFKSFNIANLLINHEIMCKNSLVAYIPKYYTHKKGIIKMVDTYFSEEYLKKAIISNIEVAEVQRMKRRVVKPDGQVEFVDRQIIIVTFLGNNTPQNVQINLVNFKIEPYIHPVVQCYNCLRFGHTSRLCKGNARCKKCAKSHDENETCDKDSLFCIHCKSEEHASLSKKCPIYSEQYNIKKIMANENTSFKEAEALVKNPSYAKIVTNNPFSVLNNLNNFPELPETSNSNVTHRPPRHTNTSTPTTRKRKARSPIRSLTPPRPKNKNSQPIIPNPYRDEIIQYKEKPISQLTVYVSSIIQNISPDRDREQKLKQETESNIRGFISSIFGKNNMSDVISVSDVESTY